MSQGKLIAVAILLTLMVIGGTAALGLSTASKLEANIHRQTANRASNVLVWCRAINADRDINRAFVAKHFQKHTAYPLQDLNCPQLAYATRQSTH